jgi:hypothetical protein
MRLLLGGVEAAAGNKEDEFVAELTANINILVIF